MYLMSEADQARLRWLVGVVEKWVSQQNWSERIVCLGTAVG